MKDVLTGKVRVTNAKCRFSVPSVHTAAECLRAFPKLQALQIGGRARVQEIVLVLLTRCVVRLDLSGNAILKTYAPLAALATRAEPPQHASRQHERIERAR